jgi:lysyl-tRNA synthetase class 2
MWRPARGIKLNENHANESEAPQEHEGQYREVKLQKLRDLQAAGLDPFLHVRYDRSECTSAVQLMFTQFEGRDVSLAGRLVAKRVHGKAGFADLQDESGRIQLYFKQSNVGDAAFELYKTLDLGDIIGVKGKVFRTRTEQISIEVHEYTLLSKILQMLPEKFHGLTDVDQRYRQRYVDLIVNREVLTRLRNRSKALSEIRRFLDGKGFLEVETPVLHATAGGATAETFKTHWNVLKADYHLRIALELHLKRLIVGGFERVYEIGRVFRNEGVSTRHNPEFTMLELYEAYVDYSDIMKLTEDLVRRLAEAVFKVTEVQYGEYKLDFGKPFAKISFNDAMEKWAGVGLDKLRTLEDVRREAARLEIKLPQDRGYEACLDEIFKERVEPNLIQPTFIFDYPKGLSPLAKSHPDNPELTYRFELFIATMELANSFSELNDPLEQRTRFENQIQDRVPDALLADCLAEKQLFEAGKAEDGTIKLSSKAQQALTQFETLIKWIASNEGNQKSGFETMPESNLVPWLIEFNEALVLTGLHHPRLQAVADGARVIRRIASDYEMPGRRELLSALHRSDEYASAELDEDFLNALEYGMPPTGGLGIGIDRLIMVLSGTPAIREVIAFPQLKNK